jgi:hypothetical protein
MPITNLKRKLEKSRDAIIKVNRKEDSAFNPYEILAIVVEGDELLGNALPKSEPPRVYRRLIYFSYAAMACSSSMA